MSKRAFDDALDLLDAGVGSAAFGAALELGLFWLLDERPRSIPELSELLGIPEPRCRLWLQLLSDLDLAVAGPGGYEPSAWTRASVLGHYSQTTWALLAQEARERLIGLGDVPDRLSRPIAVGAADHSQSYVALMASDPDRARRFTRMLFEIHRQLAEHLAEFLPLPDSGRLVDLGGGSGVVAMAALRRRPGLTATVVDIAPVCVAGRELAGELAYRDRLTYVAADLLRDELPGQADAVLECDVGVYGLDLFRRVRSVLPDSGKYLIVDQFEPSEGGAPTAQLAWAFTSALRSTGYAYPSVEAIRTDLVSAGFRSTVVRPVPPMPGSSSRLNEQLTLVEATR